MVFCFCFPLERAGASFPRQVKKLFQTMDFSGDGSINLEEFSKLVKSPKLKFWMSALGRNAKTAVAAEDPC